MPRILLSELLLAITLAYGVTAAGLVAHAASEGASFSMRPLHADPSNPITKSYFVLASKAGTTLQNGISITNTGSATGTVTLYPVDATTSQNSGLVYNMQNAPRSDVGSWLQLGQQHLTLKPGQSETVPFRVSVPQNTWSGQHIGGIVAESDTKASTQQQNTFHVNIQSLLIVAVQITVAGPLTEQLAITGVQASGANGYQNLLVNLSNTGTTLLKPYGTLQVTDEQGHVLQHTAIKLDTFLPRTTINYPVYMQNKPLVVGTYTADLLLSTTAALM